jgi:hypothetical protein
MTTKRKIMNKYREDFDRLCREYAYDESLPDEFWIKFRLLQNGLKSDLKNAKD